MMTCWSEGTGRSGSGYAYDCAGDFESESYWAAFSSEAFLMDEQYQSWVDYWNDYHYGDDEECSGYWCAEPYDCSFETDFDYCMGSYCMDECEGWESCFVDFGDSETDYQTMDCDDFDAMFGDGEDD